MEPVFIITSQSAGTAASFAIDDGVPVQQVNYPKLALQLQADGQVLDTSASSGNAGIVVDDADTNGVAIVGGWGSSTAVSGYWATDYLTDSNSNKGAKSVTFTPNLPSNDVYDVALRWTANANRATNVPVDVIWSGGSNTVFVNQQANGGAWMKIFTTNFIAGTNASVVVRTDNTFINGTTGFVIADAVRFMSTGAAPCSVQVVASVGLAAQTGGAPARVSFVRSGDSNAVISLNYTLGGTATNGTDYTVSPSTLTLAASAGATNLLIIPVANPPAADKTVVITLQAGTNYVAGALATATVTLTGTAPLQPAQMQAAGFTTNGLTIYFSGPTSQTYHVQRASDLFAAWSNIATVSGSSTNLQLADTNAPAPHAFYRTATP